MMIPHSLQ